MAGGRRFGSSASFAARAIAMLIDLMSDGRITSQVIASLPRLLHLRPRESTGPLGSRRQTEGTKHMSSVNELVISYLAAWNERDDKRRRELVARTWQEGGSYVDAHRRGDGHSGIDAMLKATQQQFPGYQLRLVSKIEAYDGYVRFSWAAGGTPEAPLYLAGTDFVTLVDGRFQIVAGFTDASPAA
jgi:hypothetical protein